MVVVGIDLGASGAIAMLEDGVLIAVHDMPILRDGPKGRPTVNGPLLADILANSHCDIVYIETVGVRPGEGPVGAFAFGRSRGIVEGVCAGLSIPCSFITAPKWKRLVGIAPGKDGAKDAARSKVIGRWPDKAEWFRRVKDDGRAEAALIAIAGMSL